MAHSCKGICCRYRAKRVKEGRYLSGQKRCNRCTIFINWGGVWCPCCGVKLRLKPRHTIYKEKMKEKLVVMIKI